MQTTFDTRMERGLIHTFVPRPAAPVGPASSYTSGTGAWSPPPHRAPVAWQAFCKGQDLFSANNILYRPFCTYLNDTQLLGIYPFKKKAKFFDPPHLWICKLVCNAIYVFVLYMASYI